MTIQTDFYGEVEYTENDLITIPDGLFGFSELRSYLPLLLSEDTGDDSIILLQSTERAEVAFVLINSGYLDPAYAPLLTPEELSYLGVCDSGELSYYSICVIRDNYLENTVNLKSPIAVNPHTRKATQVILAGSEYGYRHSLSSFPAIMEIANSNDRSDCHADTQTQKE
ncbi:MAG: flagellar assembly protein FliW [Lachnospiraceae bacterium]